MEFKDNIVYIRSRRKTVAIHIKPSGAVEVRAPLRLSKFKIESFVAEKSEWIERKLAQIAERQAARPKELPPSEYAAGEFSQTTKNLVRDWEERLGVEASFVGFRAMTTRWGSCTLSTRRIRLNAGLEYCPQKYLEYVVVHELAHLLEHNHSARFWAIVKAALPDYKTLKAGLADLQWILIMQKENKK
jgi:predicted metal-dependent hydrolase